MQRELTGFACGTHEDQNADTGDNAGTDIRRSLERIVKGREVQAMAWHIPEEHQNCDKQSHISDPRDDKGLFGRGPGFGLLVPKADQQE
ncbi:hypothetical protein D3C75_989220 [compost metagenome]